MPLPISKQELADWILRRLGAPVVNVELTDLQLEDAIDEAVQMYQNWHFDGANRSYRVIKVTEEMINGNSRIHQDLSAPMYDPADNDGYRISDRVMTYTANGRPDTIWVKFDSEERIVKSFFTLESNGSWFVYDSDAPFAELEQKTDSDGFYVAYDSDTHNAYTYTIAEYLADSNSLSTYWVDSEGSWVKYDSDRHVVTIYDSDAAGLWVDSDGSFVTFASYDSDAHITKVYTVDAAGDYYDSDGVKVLWSGIDSDTKYKFEYTAANNGVWVDSEGTWVAFDSDKHGSYSFVTSTYLVTDDASSSYVILNNAYTKVSEAPYTDIYQYAAYTQTFDSNIRVDSDTKVDVNGITFSVKNNIKKFTLKGSNDPSGVYDSDGFGNLLSFASLAGYRVYFSFNLGDVNVTTYDLNQAVVSQTQTPLALGFIKFNVNNSLTSVDFTGLYERSFVTPTPTFYDRVWNSSVTSFTRESVLADITRYSKDEIKPQRFLKQNTYPSVYVRSLELLGLRYSRVNVEIDREVLSFNEMWREEKSVLTEPMLDIDYSKQGQIGIPIPEDIISVTKVFRIDSAVSAGMWNYEYQFFLTNFDWFYGSGGGAGLAMTSYYTTKSYLEMIDHMLNTTPAIRFNKHKNRLFVDTDWKKIANKYGSETPIYMLAEVYEITDPDVYGDVYKDTWLKRYALALTKEQWGSNLKKYSGVDLPGGLQVNGQALYDEAKEEKEKLEEELKTSNLEMDSILLG